MNKLHKLFLDDLDDYITHSYNAKENSTFRYIEYYYLYNNPSIRDEAWFQPTSIKYFIKLKDWLKSLTREEVIDLVLFTRLQEYLKLSNTELVELLFTEAA